MEIKRVDKNKVIIHLKDLLVSPFYINLTNNCRNFIIKKALSIDQDLKSIAKVVNCNIYTLRNFISKENNSIRYDILQKLLDFSGISTNDIEKKVYSIKRGCNTRPVKVQLPIKGTPYLALLLAKSLGDGCVCSDWRFNYDNSERVLIEEVIRAVKKAIGKTKWTLHLKNNNCYNIKFSPVVGHILCLCGAIKGYKINSKFDIPEWIKNSNREIKEYFIRGLLDDEACVNYSPKFRTKRIIFAMAKSQLYKVSLTKFFNSIREILKEFGIETSDIGVQKEYENKVILRFFIYRKENLEKFQKEIKLTHPNKKETLKKMLETYIDISKTKNAVCEIVTNSKKPLSTLEITNLSNVKQGLIKYHLLNLAKEGKLSKTENSNPAFWWSPNKRLMNKKEKILDILAKNKLTALDVSKQLNIDWRYTFNLLNRLKTKNLISHNNSHPRIWKTK